MQTIQNKSKNNIKNQINSIMNATSLIKNSLTIFKPHPAQDIDELKSMLSNLKKFMENF